MFSSTIFHSQPILPRAIRDRLIQAVPAVEGFDDEARHHDAQELVTNLMDAVGDLLPPLVADKKLRKSGPRPT